MWAGGIEEQECELECIWRRAGIRPPAVGRAREMGFEGWEEGGRTSAKDAEGGGRGSTLAS